MDKIVYYILTALAVVITLTVHEYCHGYAAYKLGDPTAKAYGRLSLNPIKHIDPIGALCLLFFHFGWAKPVPIDARYFKKPKRDFAITALAGPGVNVFMSIFAAFFYLLAFSLLSNVTYTNSFLFALAQNLINFLYIFHIVNLGLGLFNLIPVPPLDGSRILGVLLPTKAYFAIMKYERTIYFVLIGWLLLGPYISSFLLSISFVAANPALSVIARCFSLSGLLSSAIDAISSLIINFFKLIPFLR